MGRLLLAVSVLLAMGMVVSCRKAEKSPRLGKSPIRKVIAAMTREEKVNLVLGTGMRFPWLPEEMRGPSVGEIEDRVPGAAGCTFAVPRLGIPSLVLADGPAGLRIQPFRNGDSTTSYYCTAFPIATLLASSWDTGLVERIGNAMGNEVREYGVDILLGPALNIHRNPLGGRNFEYFSEDPLVSGKMAAALVRGVQAQGVGTSIKHFAANNHEWNRTTINVKAGERTLREIYLRSFEIAVKDGNPWTVMSSYNKINGTYTSESADLLTHVLREDWKFAGFVMTDWFGGRDAAAQMKAGNDLLMPGTGIQQKALLAALRDGTLDESILDRNIERILGVVLKSPAFLRRGHSDKPDLKAHARLCREAGAEGMVLLENRDGTLPLRPGVRLAVFGVGSYEMVTGGTGSGDVNEAYSVPLTQGLKDAGFSVHAGLEEVYEIYIAEQKGRRAPPPMPFMPQQPIAEMVTSSEAVGRWCAETDMALITITRSSGEFLDRKRDGDFYLSEAEKALVLSVSSVFRSKQKKVAVVLNVGGVIETGSWRGLADAILLAWQSGQEAGHSVADVLSGATNPCGKLATTFPMEYEDVPSSAGFPGTVLEGPDPEHRSFLSGDRAAEVVYSDGIWVGYRFYNTKSLNTAYPFGFGLSYTKFEYGKVEIDSDRFQDRVTASVSVRNAGKTAGREIVQAYVSAPGKRMKKPAIELKAFAKTRLLKPGDSETLRFVLKVENLVSFDADRSAWVAEQGEYTLRIGASSSDIKGTAAFVLPGDLVVENVRKALVPQQEIRDRFD